MVYGNMVLAASCLKKSQHVMRKIGLLMMMLFIALTGFSSDGSRTISGTVYAKDDNSVLPGVTVLVKGTKVSTQTNGKGQYKIEVPVGQETLVFSYIGYNQQTIKLGKKDKLDVYMVSDNKSLSEVVVTGYGTPKKKSEIRVRGNASPQAIRADEIRIDEPVGNSDTKAVNDLLKKLPGVSVNNDGYVSGMATTKVRVNGKDYAGVKNLPADIIEKSQVIDNYGDQAVRGRAEFSNESYAKLIENKYQNPIDNPLSTFSVDVDNASYSNIRRFINGGQLPPKDAIRIEEMINYFKYQLPEPKAGEPVAIVTEMAAAPWNTNHRLLRIGLKARTIAAR
jgi:Ca-activated chloride channel family protein